MSDKATFIEGDMYEADISKATVLALFLLPHNLNKLTAKFLALKPGSRKSSQRIRPLLSATIGPCGTVPSVLTTGFGIGR